MLFLRQTKPLPLLILLCLLGGCGDIHWPGQPVAKPCLCAWPASDMTQLTDRTARFDDKLVLDDRKRVSLSAASNETVSFQVVVEGQAGDVSGLRIGCAGLAAPGGARIAGDNVRAFHMLPVQVTDFPAWRLRISPDATQPAGYYDALVPITAPQGGQPYCLLAGTRRVFWIDLAVPRTTPGGLYSGSLHLASDSHADLDIPITLRVYNFMLPDLRPIAAVGGFDYQTIFRTFVSRDGKPYEPVRLDRSNPQVLQGLSIMRQLMVLAHEHRLDLFEKELRPMLRRDVSGKANLDWEDYDNFATPYLSGGAFDDRIGVPAWPSPIRQDWPDAENYGGPVSDQYASLAAELTDQCRKHFQAIGAGDQIFAWPYRGEITPAAFDVQTRLARIIRSADTQTPVLSPLPPTAPPQTGWTISPELAGLSDIVAPPAQWLDPSLGPKLHRNDSPLRGVWLSPGLPPYLPGLSVASTPTDLRAIPWFAMKYQCSGLFLQEVLNWSGDIFNSPAGAETRLFYPGKSVGIEGVLPSVRLKHLRRGLQDIAYLWILRQRQRETIAKIVTGSLVRYAGLDAAGDHYLDPRLEGYVREPEPWELARKLLAEEIEAAISNESSPNARLLAQRLAWRQFDEQVHSIRPEQVRATIRPSQANGELTLTILADVFNEYGRDSQALLKIDSLPEGWTADVAEAKVVMPPCTRQTLTLRAHGTHVPAGGDGKMPLKLSLTADMQRRQDITAQVPFLLAGRATKPPTIDGVLDDWPLREGNTAGYFKTLGRRGNVGDGMAKRQTLVFVTYDDQNLYIALRCDEPTVDLLKAQPTNVIRYEQLMACGEDLVEVILDPGPSAKSAEDLYHIIVKSNGVILTEKGIHTDPPLGKAQAWPANAIVAVKADKQRKLWVAELAIPLSSFGPAAPPALWGANFTRFATQGMEASSWSGTPRYFYDPRNLGTMLIVPASTSTSTTNTN